MMYLGTLTLLYGYACPGGCEPLAKVPGGRLRGRLGRRGPTEPAGSPSFRGRPTGLLIFGSAFGSTGFLPLPLGRPGLRLMGTSGMASAPTTEGTLASEMEDDCKASLPPGWREGSVGTAWAPNVLVRPWRDASAIMNRLCCPWGRVSTVFHRRTSNRQ